MGVCEAQSGNETLTQIHQNISSVEKKTTFNTYQLSSSVKDIGERANRDDADALSIGQGNCCMHLLIKIFHPLFKILSRVLSRVLLIVSTFFNDKSPFHWNFKTNQIWYWVFTPSSGSAGKREATVRSRSKVRHSDSLEKWIWFSLEKANLV